MKGRLNMVIKLNGSSAKGKQIIERAQSYIGYDLSDVYTRYSDAKKQAFICCLDCFSVTPEGRDFHICSANKSKFSCAWYGYFCGEEILRYETKDNSYLIWLER